MVMAGIKKIRIHGAKEKNCSRDAKPLSSILFRKTNKTRPFTNKKTTIAI
jgi:hypothetical protein